MENVEKGKGRVNSVELVKEIIVESGVCFSSKLIHPHINFPLLLLPKTDRKKLHNSPRSLFSHFSLLPGKCVCVCVCITFFWVYFRFDYALFYCYFQYHFFRFKISGCLWRIVFYKIDKLMGGNGNWDFLCRISRILIVYHVLVDCVSWVTIIRFLGST